MPVILFQLPYAGTNVKQLLKCYLRKMRCCLKINITFTVIYNTRKYLFYCIMKDKIPYEQMHHVIKQLMCLDLCGNYIGLWEVYLEIFFLLYHERQNSI